MKSAVITGVTGQTGSYLAELLLTNELAELLGMLASDGCVKNSHIQFTNNDQSLIDRISYLWSSCFMGYTSTRNSVSGFNKSKTVKQTNLCGKNSIISWLREQLYIENSHVIPALIRKFYEAKQNVDEFVTCWGTGSATREFLYAGDAAEAIVNAVISEFSSELPINLGTGSDISIKNLAEKIADIVGYTGKIKWDTSKPDGQPKRMLDVSRARQLLGFQASTSFDEGLRKTVEWYDWYSKNSQKD